MNEEMNQAVEAQEIQPQEPEIGKLWDEEGEAATNQAGDQRLEEPGEGEAQTSGDPTSEEHHEEAAEGDGQEPGQQGATQEGQTSPPESFTLRHMDDPPVTVGREEVIRLAQQGLDYERVRTERDQLREYRAQADPALNLVKTFAENSGMTLEAYVDYCRTQALIAQGVNEATAKAQVEMEKRQARMDAQTRAAEPEQQRRQTAEAEEQAKAAAQKRDMEAFIGAYPDVKADEIPKEVWQKVAGGESLVTAYTMYLNQQLRAKMAAQEQNRENAAKAPGSLGTRGEQGRKTIADYWDEAEG